MTAARTPAALTAWRELNDGQQATLKALFELTAGRVAGLGSKYRLRKGTTTVPGQLDVAHIVPLSILPAEFR